MKPAAYITKNGGNLWVMDDNVCIFKTEHAKIVFAPGHHYDGLKVWAIKDGKALMVMSVYEAQDFFEGTNET